MPAEPTPVRTMRAAPIAILAVVLITATTLALLGRDGHHDQTPGTGSTVHATAMPAPSLSGSGAGGVPSASWSGHDAAEDDTAAPAARATAQLFLEGWLTADRARRTRLLQVSATPELAAELEWTDPAVIPSGPVRSMTPVGGSKFSAEFIAELRDLSVRVVLAADPEAPHGWFVVSIEPDD